MIEMKRYEGIDGVIRLFKDILTEAGASHIRELSEGKKYSKDIMIPLNLSQSMMDSMLQQV